jgi:hypothetical protein
MATETGGSTAVVMVVVTVVTVAGRGIQGGPLVQVTLSVQFVGVLQCSL